MAQKVLITSVVDTNTKRQSECGARAGWRSLRFAFSACGSAAVRTPTLGGIRAAQRAAVTAALLLIAMVLPGCTSMGFDHPALRDSINYGAPQEVRLCVYLDNGITPQDAQALLDSWNEEAQIYGLYVRPVSFTPMTREGFFHTSILEQVDEIPLGPSCDRVLYFVNRNPGDYAFGLIAATVGVPEILGEVDDPTLTHGYVVARRATINQIVMSPYGVTRHEMFHLLGCPEHFDMPDCYRRIHDLKLAREKLQASGYFAKHHEESFYPTYASRTHSMLVSRKQVGRYQQLESGEGATSLAR
jgi:hypothetical protein